MGEQSSEIKCTAKQRSTPESECDEGQLGICIIESRTCRKCKLKGLSESPTEEGKKDATHCNSSPENDSSTLSLTHSHMIHMIKMH